MGLQEGNRGEAEMDRDVRLLSVLFDAGEERWRTVEEAAPESFEEPLEDWPIEGPRTVLDGLQQMRRQGLNWSDLHNQWVSRPGVSVSDRSVHQHASF